MIVDKQSLVRSYLNEIPKCKNCNKEMYVDDLDYSFEGCQDEYWLCPNCNDSVFVKVRYGKVCKKIYQRGDEIYDS